MVSASVGERAAEAECDLGWSVGMLMRNYKAHADPCVGDLPRGARGYQLLYTVVRKNIPNQLRLAEYLGIDRSVMPYVIDDLVEAGLVERQPDPADRRARKVVATPLGIEKFQQLEAQMARAENRPFGAGHLCLQLLELLDAKWGGHHFACTTISGIRLPFDQSGLDQVIDHVRHHRTVDTQVLRKPQLIGDVLANHRVEKLIAARTARQITDARVRMSLVVPHQHPDRPTKVALGLSGTFTNTRTHHTPSLTQLVCHATELFGKQIEHTSGYDPESVPRGRRQSLDTGGPAQVAGERAPAVSRDRSFSAGRRGWCRHAGHADNRMAEKSGECSRHGKRHIQSPQENAGPDRLSLIHI